MLPLLPSLVLVLAGPFLQERSATLDPTELVESNTVPIRLEEGRLEGAGSDLILSEARNAQFVLIGEPHNTDQVNRFTVALFRRLHDELGFRYLALEQGPLIIERYGAPPFRGDLEAIRADARTHGFSLHFGTDEELALLAAVGEHSKAKAPPLWGVDRILGAELALKELLTALEDADDEAAVEGVLEAARAHNAEMLAKHDVETAVARRFLVSESEDLDRLLAELPPPGGSRAATILTALRISRRNLRAYSIEHPPGDPWGYLANLEREDLMRRQFTTQYRAALDRGEEPRVLVKMGHWHTRRGMSDGNVYTLGNTLAGAATLNGRDSLAIAISLVNRPGRHWSITDSPEFRLFHGVADPEQWKVVDLRPLRGYVHSGALRVPAPVRGYIFGFDLLLLIGGSDAGTYSWLEGTGSSGKD